MANVGRVAAKWGLVTALACGGDAALQPQPDGEWSPLQAGSLAVGGAHTCALATDGSAYCWGWNFDSQLGDGTTTSRRTPTRVATSVRFASLVAGPGHNCGLTDDGRAYCWGENTHGQVGNGVAGGQEADRRVPVAVSTSLRFAQLALGGEHTCGIATDGRTYCWGNNTNGQLGAGAAAPGRSLTPVAVETPVRFQHLTAGIVHTCGLAADGRTYCWGHNGGSPRFPGVGDGRLGDGTVSDRRAPVAVNTRARFREIAAGYGHNCALDSRGTLHCWGTGWAPAAYGRTPTVLPSPVAFRALGRGHSLSNACALTNSGDAYCWGYNMRGQLGDGTTRDRHVPVAVATELTFR